jgi:hypothetical protein
LNVNNSKPEYRCPAALLAENGKNAISRRKILAENGIYAISRLKIRTWTTMPLKVGIIATFRGLLSDCSPLEKGQFI